MEEKKENSKNNLNVDEFIENQKKNEFDLDIINTKPKKKDNKKKPSEENFDSVII